MRFNLILLCLFFLGQHTLIAQELASDEERMEAAVKALTEGGLVVLLPTKAKTIHALEEMLANGQLAQKSRIQLKKRLEYTKSNVKRDQEWIISLFSRYYTSGATYFIFDTDFKNLKNEQLTGYFLDKNLAIDPSIKRPDDFLIVRKGSPDQGQYTTGEALIVYDKNGDDLPALFPSVASMWGLAFSKDQVDFMRYRNAIRKLSSRLVKMKE